tara:strand:- start:26 stop:1123 length:1098 start_codon:yes stop_codon:yes gene_type:complete
MSISTETIDNSYLLFIRSKEVVQNNTDLNTDMTINLQAEISRNNVLQDIHLQLNSCSIPHTFYNFSSRLKNINLFVDGVSNLVLDSQHYDIYELVDFINNSSSFKYSITFKEQQNKIILTNTDSTAHVINFGEESSKGLAKALGFKEVDVNMSADESIISDNSINLNTVHSIFVHTNLPVNNVITTTDGNYRNIIQKIPIKNTFGDIIEYNPYENGIFSTIINQNSINSMDISLRDQNDILIDFNKANFELSFLFEIHQKTQEIIEPIGGGRRSEFIDLPQRPIQPNTQQIPQQIQQRIQQQPQINNINQIPINKLGFSSQTKNTPVVSIPLETVNEDEVLHDRQSHELQKKIMDLEISVLDDIL